MLRLVKERLAMRLFKSTEVSTIKLGAKHPSVEPHCYMETSLHSGIVSSNSRRAFKIISLII